MAHLELLHNYKLHLLQHVKNPLLVFYTALIHTQTLSSLELRKRAKFVNLLATCRHFTTLFQLLCTAPETPLVEHWANGSIDW